MAIISVQFVGAGSAKDYLTELQNPKVVAKGVETVAVYFRDTLVNTSQVGHPSGPNVVSGRLSGSMTYVMEGNTAHVGSTVEYAPYVEMGHMSRSWGSNRWHVVPAYPWFRPAVTQVFDSGEAQEIYRAAILAAIGK